jgi:phosphocarrier protein FPr
MQFLQKFFTKPKTIQLMITSNNGFHLRPVAQFVSVAKTFACQVTATHKNRTVDAKGVNNLLSISLEKGDTFTLTCKGKDAQEALDALTVVFNTLMLDDEEIEVIEKEETYYEGECIDGDIISSGIAIAPTYHYKEESIQKESLLSFEEAFHKSIDELEVLYDDHKENTNAGIYLAQKELLASLETEAFTLQDLEEQIKKSSEQLLGSKLEAKISDYKDILQRVKKHLGFEVKTLFPDKDFILLANNLLPSQIEKLSHTSVSAVILKASSINSHTAILLRGAGIVSLIADTSLLEEKTNIIVDAHAGVIVTNPGKSDLEKAQKRFAQDELEKDQAFTHRFNTATTNAGKTIKVLANVTDVDSAKIAKEEGAEGIGLLRTEFLFKEEKPSFELQVDAYKKIFEIFDDITVRTLDVGGDKALPYIALEKEDNPFLGIRGIRLLKTHPEILQEQLHAIFVAAQNRMIKVMFPMISTPEEFSEAKTFAQKIANKNQLDISNIHFGIMIEVPSVLFLLEEFNAVVDFYSIGTNDLTQYLFAIERTHATLKTDDLSAAVFAAIQMIVDNATKPVSICGELGGNEKAIPKLLKIGIETLSVSGKNIAKTKEIIRHV